MAVYNCVSYNVQNSRSDIYINVTEWWLITLREDREEYNEGIKEATRGGGDGDIRGERDRGEDRQA